MITFEAISAVGATIARRTGCCPVYGSRRASVIARHFLVLAFVAGCARVNVVKSQGVELPPIQFPLRSMTYPSGLRVLFERDSRTNLAGIFLVVGTGSTSDPAGKLSLVGDEKSIRTAVQAGWR